MSLFRSLYPLVLFSFVFSLVSALHNSSDPCNTLSGRWTGTYGYYVPKTCSWTIAATIKFNVNLTYYQMYITQGILLEGDPETCEWWPSYMMVYGACTNAIMNGYSWGRMLKGNILKGSIVMANGEDESLTLHQASVSPNVVEADPCSMLNSGTYTGTWACNDSDFCIWSATSTPLYSRGNMQMAISFVITEDQDPSNDCVKTSSLSGSGTCSAGILSMTFDMWSYIGTIMEGVINIADTAVNQNAARMVLG